MQARRRLLALLLLAAPVVAYAEPDPLVEALACGGFTPGTTDLSTQEWAWSSSRGQVQVIEPRPGWVTSDRAVWINDGDPSGTGIDPAALAGAVVAPDDTPGVHRYFTGWDGRIYQGFNQRLELRYAADDVVVFYVNGAPIGGPSPFLQQPGDQFGVLVYPLHVLDTDVTVLEARVLNVDGDTGLLVEATLHYCYHPIH